jgi:hypothetical protein
MQPAKDDGVWMAFDRDTLVVNDDVIYHFPASLAAAYGSFARFDLGTVAGLLDYVAEFVNRREKHGTEFPQVRTVGRENLRRLFRAAVHGPSAPGDIDLANPSDELLNDLRQRTRDSVRKSSLDRKTGGAGWRHHVFIESADEFYVLLTILLMNEQHRHELAQCKHCDIFFVVKKRAQREGRPERVYCTPQHRIDAHEKGAAGRQRKARACRKLGKRHGEDQNRAAVQRAFDENPSATVEQLVESANAIIKATRTKK